MDTTAWGLPTVPDVASNPGIGQPGERSTAPGAGTGGAVSGRDASTVAGGGAGAGAGNGGASAHTNKGGADPGDAGAGIAGAGGRGTGGGGGNAGRAEYARTDSRDPTPVPGTPGQDTSEPEHRTIVSGTDSEGEESSYNDFVESLDPAALAAEFRRFVQYDPSTLSTQDIKAQLKLYLQDSTPAVAAPKQQTEVVMLSQGPIDIGSNQMMIDVPGPSRAEKKRTRQREAAKRRKRRKRQHVTIDENNTDTAPESAIEDTTSSSEPETEPESLTNITQDSNRPSCSPSPLPWEHTPTTHASTQAQLTSCPEHSSTCMPTVMAETTSVQRPPTQSQASTSLVPPSQPSGTQSQPRKTKSLPLRPLPSSPARSALPRSARYHKPHPRNDTKQASQRRDESSAQASTSATHTSADAKTLHQAAKLLRLAKSSGKLARIVREHHRRQAVALAAGVSLEDIGPALSETEQLERDLVPDNEKELASQEAEEAGELPVGRKRKPSARDLHGYDRQIISAAKAHLLAYSLKEGPVQTRTTFGNWAVWLRDAAASKTPYDH
ncbi:hypothetical protein FRC10_008452 [Ceratobasidium sp. 414]|nr:hypothetical protein FRC10_008452 [Ceratobasidium sp. 414]